MESFFVILLYILIFAILALECYLVSSPIFYPRVSWWEYDFRYRGDLKVRITHKNVCFEGRLTDLRRGAGCVVLFEDLANGEDIEIELVESSSYQVKLKGEIVSKREPVIGRGITYGLRLEFDHEIDRKAFLEFSREWQEDRRKKKSLKFRKV
jgi:hypothetical protein